jgi:hypothetical protein
VNVSARTEVLLWANRIVNKGNASPNHLLEIRDSAGLDEAQAAFHKVARMAHPDLHRASLTPEELELVTQAYAKVAGAYQELRNMRMQTSRLPRANVSTSSIPVTRGTTSSIPVTRGTTQDLTGIASGDKPSGIAGSAQAMSSKALVYYRKAEMSLKRGDLRGAVLQLKMAIAADPLSTHLRSALSEVESELAKGG